MTSLLKKIFSNPTYQYMVIISFAMICAIVIISYLQLPIDTVNQRSFTKPATAPKNITATSTHEFKTTHSSTKKTIAIPILMYHHIRDYNNSRDPIGTNLSVSPKIFSQQLAELKKHGFETITFNDVADGNIPKKPIILTFDDGYDDNYLNAYPLLKQYDSRGVFYIIDNRVETPGYLSQKQIRDIIADNFEIGGHSWSHRDLKTASTTILRKEIVDSKKWLEKKFNIAVNSFCYPSGQYQTSTVKMVGAAGFTTAVTTQPGMGIITAENKFTLHRFRVGPNSDIKKILNLK